MGFLFMPLYVIKVLITDIVHVSINHIPSIVNEAIMADINSCQEILSFIIH